MVLPRGRRVTARRPVQVESLMGALYHVIALPEVWLLIAREQLCLDSVLGIASKMPKDCHSFKIEG